MKLIFSRKGFDSGFGGAPSPLFPNQQMVSLPIPGGRAPHRFDELATPMGPMGRIAQELTHRAPLARAAVHLDPDLDATTVPRLPDWRPSLGQVDAAQSHLAGQGVGPGDLFLFFGWFRPVEHRDGAWTYVRGAPAVHALFGYLQIGEVLPLGTQPDAPALLAERPWLHDHPHLDGTRSANNTLYLAADRLTLPDGPTDLPGAGAFDRVAPALVLTAPGQAKSRWALPAWCAPAEGDRGALSYHGDPNRWLPQADGSVWLQTVAKGQEFVMDLPDAPAAVSWLRERVERPLRGAVHPVPQWVEAWAPEGESIAPPRPRLRR